MIRRVCAYHQLTASMFVLLASKQADILPSLCETVIQHIDAENGQIQSEQAIVLPEGASSGHRNVHRPKLSSAASLSNMWRYENYALSDRDIGGIVQFPSQNSSFRAGFEGGSVAAFGQRKRFREDIHQQQHVIANSIGFEAVFNHFYRFIS